MSRNRLTLSSFILLTFLAVGVSFMYYSSDTVQAQGNLLANPGFETEGNWTPVQSGGGGIFSAPPNWGGWYDPASASVPNGYPHRRAFVDDDATEEEIGVANGINSFIRSGNFSANFGRGGGAFTAAIYQQASVPEETNVTGTAYFINNIPAGANFQARVGIDPNGGTNPNDTDVVWSTPGVNQIGSFRQLSASATATGPTVTLFLYFSTTVSVDPNDIYWDDASLSIGGAGGAAPGAEPSGTPVPTPVPEVAFVDAQAPQEDGSIVHTVNQGDTLSSIAVAYGVTNDEILALNNLADARFLRVGQQLLIRPAPSPEPEEEQPEPTATRRPTEAPDEADDEEADSGGQAVAQAPTEDEEVEEEPAPTSTPRPTEAPEEPEEPEEDPTEPPAPTDEPEPTEPPPPTNTSIPPSATDAPAAPVEVADANTDIDPSSELASVCVMLFDDANQNRVQEAEEPGLAGGTISLMQNGESMDTFATDGTLDPFCFSDLASGEYTAAATAPGGYGLTTADQLRLRVQPGSSLNIVFGAAEGFQELAPPPANAGDLEQVVVEDTEAESDPEGALIQYLGLIVLGLAGLALIGGLGAALALRR